MCAQDERTSRHSMRSHGHRILTPGYTMLTCAYPISRREYPILRLAHSMLTRAYCIREHVTVRRRPARFKFPLIYWLHPLKQALNCLRHLFQPTPARLHRRYCRQQRERQREGLAGGVVDVFALFSLEGIARAIARLGVFLFWLCI